MAGETHTDSVERILNAPGLADALESDRFKQFLDHVPVAIAGSELRPSESIIYVNLEFERLVGRTASELQGENWQALPGVAAAIGNDEGLSHAVETGEEYIGRFRIALSTHEIEVDAWSNTIQDDDGNEVFRLVALAEIGGAQQSESADTAQKLRDKDVLLLELQHRVKNNLQMITALIRMEARNLPEGDTDQRFDRLAGRINALSLLYDLLSAQGLGENIDLGIYLSKVATSVMEAHGVEGIRLDLLVDVWPVSINVAMPTGLVVNELLTNSLKHAFPDQKHGTIKVRALVDDVGCHVTIGDDGVGLPEGVIWPKPGKLGAVIAQSLRDNAKAKVSVISHPHQGMEVTLFFERAAAASI